MSKIQDKGLSLDREDLDAQLQAAADKQKKAKRKKKIRRIIIIAIVVLIVLVIGIAILIGTLLGKNKKPSVQVTHAANEEITQEVKISGVVSSDNIQHYYSPSAIKVESCVPVGTFVKKGDPIITFDSESYNNALKQLELSDKISDNNYQSTVTDMNQVQSKYNQACSDINKYQALVDEYQAKVDEYDNKDSDFYKFTNINAPKQIEIEQNILMNPLSTQEEIDEATQVIASLKLQLQYNAEEVAEATKKLSEYKVELESAKSKKDAYGSTLGNQYDKENRDLTGELNSIKTGSAYDELAKYTNGCLVAPFDGIVIASYVSEGMTTSNMGAEIATFASTEDISIDFNLNKKELAKVVTGQKVDITVLDYEYVGTVERISRMANASASGSASVSAVISVDNPDDNIYLGLEAKCVIETGHKDSCLTVPSECINIDSEGYYIYTVDDMNTVQKNYIEMGLTSEDRTEILSGVTEEDSLVKIVTGDVKEGAMVVPVDADAMSDAMAEAMSMISGME